MSGTIERIAVPPIINEPVIDLQSVRLHPKTREGCCICGRVLRCSRNSRGHRQQYTLSHDDSCKRRRLRFQRTPSDP